MLCVPFSENRSLCWLIQLQREGSKFGAELIGAVRQKIILHGPKMADERLLLSQAQPVGCKRWLDLSLNTSQVVPRSSQQKYCSKIQLYTFNDCFHEVDQDHSIIFCSER